MSYLISYPVSHISGEISLPGDKSISHRAIILSSISEGKTIVQNFLPAQDTLNTLKAFKAMGVTIERLSHTELCIHGVGKFGLKKPIEAILCGNSATTMRLLAGLLAGQSFKVLLKGDESLHKRPMQRILTPLERMGAFIQSDNGYAPLTIQGRKLNGITYQLPIASAQVKSALLLAGLYAQGKTVIIEPQSTRNHTELLLKHFSYPIECHNNTLEIDSVHPLISPHKITIPGDLSSAAFFIVAASVCNHSHIVLKRIGINPNRLGAIEILREMGADIRLTNHTQYGKEAVADITVKSSALHGIDIPSHYVSTTIDEFPILFIAAACAKGITRLKGAQELRVKESDRIKSMVIGLRSLGIPIHDFPDGVVIEGGTLRGGFVDSYHDHRIAMAFAVAGAVSKDPVIILNSDNIITSFPTFKECSNQLALAIREL